jgi:ribonuclease HI
MSLHCGCIMPHKRIKVFFDGGCRPNPGVIEAAVVVRGQVHWFDDLGHGDNQDAEWRALLCAVEWTQGMGPVELIGDAAQVVAEANLALREGRVVNAYAQRLLAMGRPARIRWIKREQNLAGIALERRRAY